MKWEPGEVRKDVDTAAVGPLYLVARNDSYTLATLMRWQLPVRDVAAETRSQARKAVVDTARKLLSEWAAELDALEHQS